MVLIFFLLSLLNIQNLFTYTDMQWLIYSSHLCFLNHVQFISIKVNSLYHNFVSYLVSWCIVSLSLDKTVSFDPFSSIFVIPSSQYLCIFCSSYLFSAFKHFGCIAVFPHTSLRIKFSCGLCRITQRHKNAYYSPLFFLYKTG